jgi:hypothetical protein
VDLLLDPATTKRRNLGKFLNTNLSDQETKVKRRDPGRNAKCVEG